jgi:hypothetical protein
VAVSISVVPEERPRTAGEFSEMIVDGAAGVSPWSDDAPTRHTGKSGAATRVLPAQQRNYPTQETMVVSREPSRAAAARPPRTVPARRPVPQETPPVRAEQRGGGRRAARRLGWIFALVVVIAVIAVVAVLALHQSSASVVQEKRVIANDWRTAINQLQNIINQYTR